MRLSDRGKTLIQSFEGLSLSAYPDADGYSIGYGHFLGKDPALASRTISRAEADALFDRDVQKFETAVALGVAPAPSTLQHEFDAFTSLAYNIGTGGFAGSTALRRHLMGDKAGAADAILMWNKSQGAVHPGLVKRREKERGVYLHGYDGAGSFPLPPPPQNTEGWPALPNASGPSPSPAFAGAVIAALALAAYFALHR